MAGKWIVAGAFLSACWIGGGVAAALEGPTEVEPTLIVNPHAEPAVCMSCHTAIPDPRSAAAGQYSLLKPGIDETCAVCHGLTCCEPSRRHNNHPVGIDRWDKEKFGTPRTLPLFNGFITCATCHFFREQGHPPKTALLRIVKVKENGRLDWTGLCQDCHIND